MNEFVVYVLYSKSYNRLYIGFTSNLIKRIQSHNYFSTRGYTKKYRPWLVVYLEFYGDKSLAMRREKQLKSSRGRRFIREEVLLDYK